MATSSMASPLCTWLVAACMSVACESDCPRSSYMLGYSKRMGKWSRRRQAMSKCSRGSSELNRGLISSFSRSRIQGFMSSCLALCAYLNVIDLHDNMLSGMILQQLGLLIRLSAFDVFDAAIPFGGYKMSGQGRVKGIYNLRIWKGSRWDWGR